MNDPGFLMPPKTTYSWIFLAMALCTKPVSFRSIAEIADGINHAVPSHKEMQMSLRWLMDQQLVSKEGKKYLLTSQGRAFYLAHTQQPRFIMDAWKSIETAFSGMIQGPITWKS